MHIFTKVVEKTTFGKIVINMKSAVPYEKKANSARPSLRREAK